MISERIEMMVKQLVGQELPEDLQKVLVVILDVFDCQTGTIHVLGKDSGELELCAQCGIPEVLMAKVSQIPIGKGIAGAAAEQRAPVQICNLQTDQSGVAKPAAKKTHVAGSLAVPILVDRELKGTLGIGKFQPHDFSKEEVDALSVVADWLGAGV